MNIPIKQPNVNKIQRVNTPPPRQAKTNPNMTDCWVYIYRYIFFRSSNEREKVNTLK